MSLFPEIDEEIKAIRMAEADKLNEIKESCEIWKPSNGTEGMLFEESQCFTCSKDSDKKVCAISITLYMNGHHEDIRRYLGAPICFSHSKFNAKDFIHGHEELKEAQEKFEKSGVLML